MNTLVKTLVRRLVHAGVRRGLVGGNRMWLYVGAVSWIARLLMKEKRPIVRRETLEPGQTLLISNVPRSQFLRRNRKKANQTE